MPNNVAFQAGYQRLQCWIAALCLCGSLLASTGWADTASAGDPPLLEDSEPAAGLRPEMRWRIDAAQRALRHGMPWAADFFAELIESYPLPEQERTALQLDRVSALIGAGRFGEAETVLRSLPSPLALPQYEAARLLRLGIVSFRQGRIADSREFLESIATGDVSSADRVWLLVMRGLHLEQSGRYPDAIPLYEEARGSARSANQTRVVESLIQRNRILQGRRSESLVRDLQELLEENRFSRLAVQFAQELAVALFNLGREAEALQVLNRQIEATLPENRDQLDQLHLLGALLEREAGRTGDRYLQWLLRESTIPGFQQVAVRFLMQAAVDVETQEALLAEFGEVLRLRRDHPLAPEIYFARGMLYQRTGKLGDAQRVFDLLLSEYPGSALAAESLRMLGFISWEAGQFRTAADYFSRLRAALPVGADRLEAGVLQADAFFRNEDYETASRAYEAVFPELADNPLREQVLYQWVLSVMRAGALDQAALLLDSHPVTSAEAWPLRWQAEWNLADAMRKVRSPDEAYQRIQSLTESRGADGIAMPDHMRLRFLWLEALLALDAGNFREVPPITDSILELLESDSVPDLEEGLAEEITLRTLMILSQSYLREAAREGSTRVGDEGVLAGFEVIDRMESRYPDHEVTIQALFEKARFLRSIGRAVDAQNLYLSIFERRADSVYAPVALYEAAINAANLIALENPETLNIRTSEPIQLLNRLTENYSQDTQLFFYARLKQGDIARDLGQFAVAQALYEELLRAFPEHSLRHLAEMGRAESLLAQAGNDAGRLGEAIIAFERLFERPSVPTDLRIEAGYKWAFALETQRNLVRSQAVHNLLQTRFLETNGADLGPTGRYWMSRSLLNAAALYEQNGELRAARRQFQKILQYGLPGGALATANLERLGFDPVVTENFTNP